MAPATTEARTLTGAEGAYVNVITQVRDKKVLTQFYVNRGEALPDNLADGELERLEAAGAFEPTTHRERAAEARANRNRLRGANVAPTKARQRGNLDNNPKTPDVTAPPPGTPMAPPMTQAEAAAYGTDAEGAPAAAPPPATDDATPSGDPDEQGIALEDYTVEELREMAKDAELTGYSSLNKADLIKAIQAAEQAPPE